MYVNIGSELLESVYLALSPKSVVRPGNKCMRPGARTTPLEAAQRRLAFGKLLLDILSYHEHQLYDVDAIGNGMSVGL